MFVVSWSRLKLWRRCHKAYDYRYNQRLARKKPSVPLIRGTILGEMINAMAVKGSKVTPESVLEKYYRKYRKLFKQEREIYGDLIDECRRIFEGYRKFWKDDPLIFERTEALVTVDLSPDIRFIGYIDKIARDKRDMRWVLDHKSHRSLPNEEVRFSDLQTVFYVWAWNTQYPRESVSGIVWDYLRTKPPTIPEVLKDGSLSQRKNMDTDYDTYMRAIRENNLDPKDYRETLKRLEGSESHFYRRVPLPHPPQSMIDQIVKEARDTATEIMELGEVLHDRNMGKDCAWCDFRDICQAELRGLDADFIRKAHYTIREHAEEHEDGEESE